MQIKSNFGDLIKLKSAVKIILVEGDKIIYEDGRNATILNNFFSNAPKNLKIPDYQGADTRADNISLQVLKVIFKYRKLPTIDLLKNLKIMETFEFIKEPFEDVVKEIRKLNARKAVQSTNIHVKFFKLNNDIFGTYVCDSFNESIDTGQFSFVLKQVDITPAFKKDLRVLKKIIHQSVFSR